MNKILMISTGGTLASSHSDNGLSPGLHGNDVLDRIRGLTAGFQIEEEELFMLDSSNVQPEEWTKIARTVYERRKEYDGIVIIHGTDTLAYTASACMRVVISLCMKWEGRCWTAVWLRLVT